MSSTAFILSVSDDAQPNCENFPPGKATDILLIVSLTALCRATGRWRTTDKGTLCSAREVCDVLPTVRLGSHFMLLVQYPTGILRPNT